jgi:hypothetical protein
MNNLARRPSTKIHHFPAARLINIVPVSANLAEFPQLKFMMIQKQKSSLNSKPQLSGAGAQVLRLNFEHMFCGT